MTNLEKSSLSYFIRHLYSTMECDMLKRLICSKEVQELIPPQESNSNQVKILGSKLVKKLGPNQTIEVHTHFPLTECDFERLWAQFQDLLVQY